MKTYTEEEVKSLIEDALHEVDRLITIMGQTDGYVEINYEELKEFYKEKEFTNHT